MVWPWFRKYNNFIYLLFIYYFLLFIYYLLFISIIYPFIYYSPFVSLHCCVYVLWCDPGHGAGGVTPVSLYVCERGMFPVVWPRVLCACCVTPAWCVPLVWDAPCGVTQGRVGPVGTSLCFAAMAKADWLAASGVTLAVCFLRYRTTCGVTLGVCWFWGALFTCVTETVLVFM